MILLPTRVKRALAIFAVLAPTLAVTACLNVEPKVLGQQGNFDFSAFNGAGVQGLFTFNFGLITQTTSGGVTTNTVSAQGTDNAKSAIIGTCNLTGSSCLCKFTDSLGNTLGSPVPTTYDSGGNYLTCIAPNNIAGLVSNVTVTNLDFSVTSIVTPVTTSVTLNQLIGSGLDANRVRTVSRYQCEYNFLQKAGTSAAGFDCTNQAMSCDPNGGISGNPRNFCILKARYPFYLFADTFSTNFSSKIADKLYGTSAAPTICSLTIKQINCVESDIDPSQGGVPDTFGTPVKQFGLYGVSTGIWQTAVSLPSGPNQPAATFGFAAAVSTTSGNCPPGLVKRVFFTTAVDPAALPVTSNPSSNMVVQTATEVSDPTIVPNVFTLAKLSGGGSGGSGGNCNNTSCTMPNSSVVNGLPTYTYSSANQTAFCVIPAATLR
jgi:hypothetical protein